MLCPDLARDHIIVSRVLVNVFFAIEAPAFVAVRSRILGDQVPERAVLTCISDSSSYVIEYIILEEVFAKCRLVLQRLFDKVHDDGLVSVVDVFR